MQDWDKIKWPIRTSELAKLFGSKYHYIRNIFTNYGPKKGIKFINDVDIFQGRQGKGTMTLVTKKGAIKIAKIIKSQDAQLFLKYCGEEPDSYKIEDFISNTIIYAIDGHTKYDKSFVVDDYRIDLYLSALGIVVEIDELDHMSYNKYNEIKRENNIRDKLNCKYIVRLNPHSDDINYKVGILLNNIFSIIYNNMESSDDLLKLQKWSAEEKDVIIRNHEEKIKFLKAIEEADL